MQSQGLLPSTTTVVTARTQQQAVESSSPLLQSTGRSAVPRSGGDPAATDCSASAQLSSTLDTNRTPLAGTRNDRLARTAPVFTPSAPLVASPPTSPDPTRLAATATGFRLQRLFHGEASTASPVDSVRRHLDTMFAETEERRKLRNDDHARFRSSVAEVGTLLNGLLETLDVTPKSSSAKDVEEALFEASLEPPVIDVQNARRVGFGANAVIDPAAEKKVVRLTGIVGSLAAENRLLRERIANTASEHEFIDNKVLELESLVHNQQLKITSMEQVVRKLKRNKGLSTGDGGDTDAKSERQGNEASPRRSINAERRASINLMEPSVVDISSLGGKSMDSGPRGKVCFVMCHVQGANTLWDLAPMGTRKALNVYSDIVRLTTEEYSGYEVKAHSGDSFFIVFEKPEAAIKFCVDVQLKLMEADWAREWESIPHTSTVVVNGKPIYKGLRVAMGLHFGEAMTECDPLTGRTDYVGPCVNLCAEIERASTGGLITLSDAVAQDAEASSYLQAKTSEVEMRSIGKKQLLGTAETTLSLLQLVPLSLRGRLDDQERNYQIAAAEKEEIQKRWREANADAPTGIVGILCFRVEGAEQLHDEGEDLHDKSIHLFRSEALKVVQFSKGYVARDSGGDKFMVTFHTAKAAFKCAMDLHLALLDVDWPAKLLQWPAAQVEEQHGEVMYRGLRLQVGIHECEVAASGDMDRVTGRIVYTGPELNVAYGLAQVALGGETLLSAAAYGRVADCLHEMDDAAVKPYGRHIRIPEVSHQVTAFMAFPRKLVERSTILQQVVDNPQQAQTYNAAAFAVDLTHKPIKNLIRRVPYGAVAIVVTEVPNWAELWERDEGGMAVAMNLVRRKLATLSAHSNGYEVSFERDTALTVFQHVADAAQYCLNAQEQLLTLTYPSTLLALESARVEHDKKGRTIWNGPRIAMTLHCGTPRVEMDGGANSKVRYFGRAISVAFRIAAVARAGLTTLSPEAHEAILPEMKRLNAAVLQQLESEDSVVLDTEEDPAHKPQSLWVLVPKSLEARLELPTKTAPRLDAISRAREREKPLSRQPSASTLVGNLGVSPPEGTVALVFTEVEGSVALWESCPTMPQAVKLMQLAFREAIQQSNGYEVRTDQDAFMIAFRSPVEAVQWALQMQQTLLQLAWPADLLQQPLCKELHAPDASQTLLFRGLRVRISVHVDEPLCVMDGAVNRLDYFGPAVYRASKIGIGGHGGQIIVSSSVHDVLENPILGEPRVTALGKRLIPIPNQDGSSTDWETELFSVLPQGLPRAFPPLKAMDGQLCQSDFYSWMSKSPDVKRKSIPHRAGRSRSPSPLSKVPQPCGKPTETLRRKPCKLALAAYGRRSPFSVGTNRSKSAMQSWQSFSGRKTLYGGRCIFKPCCWRSPSGQPLLSSRRTANTTR